jgi:hypothetical protein
LNDELKMIDYVKNYHVFYRHYRQSLDDHPFPLLEPEHHILYLDMCWHGKKGVQFTLAEMAFHMRISVKALVDRIDRLGDVELISFPHGPRYSEDRPNDYLMAPRQTEGTDVGQDFDKDYNVLHEFYRHSFENYEPLLSPLRHMLYLDLQTISALGMSATIDEIRKSYGQQLSRKETIRWLKHLKIIDLIECSDLANISFASPFEFNLKPPYREEELRANKHRDLTLRMKHLLDEK